MLTLLNSPGKTHIQILEKVYKALHKLELSKAEEIATDVLNMDDAEAGKLFKVLIKEILQC